ncbi:MAG: AAA family ATPase [Magnetococcales bacterium]|nr:AAA family ATPase [Magnetococcales bacterium]
MITSLTIRNFKSIKEIKDLRLDHFHVLVGPNGSGKSTFLDALQFVRDCVETGPKKAVEKRSILDFNDLTYRRQGGVIEFEIVMNGDDFSKEWYGKFISYLLRVGYSNVVGVCFEFERLISINKINQSIDVLFVSENDDKVVVNNFDKDSGFLVLYGNSFFNYMLHGKGGDFEESIGLVKQLLTQHLRYLQLDSMAMRLPCPVTQGSDLALDGSNLARVVGRLRGETGRKPDKRSRFKQTPILKAWTRHLQYALPDLQAIGWNRREADNAEYLLLKYADGLECPSWLLSDGTLRMLALTLIAFLPPTPGVYLIEEPENGVHPKAVEVIIRALSTVPKAQVFVATHSPLVVQQVEPAQLLCFTTGEEGTEIIPGSQHPVLQGWDGSPDLATIFASGILG